MSRAFLPKAVLLLVLILLLVAPSTQAAEGGTNPVRDVPSRLAPWDVVTQVWELLTRAWAGNGCLIEPDGRCVPYQSPPPEPDNGCLIEPNGRCDS